MSNHQRFTPEFQLLTAIFGPKAAVTDNGESAFLINEAVKLKIREVLDTLPEERENLILYKYGFLDGTCHSLAETADQFGISPDEAKKTEALALRMLRHPSRSVPIRRLVFITPPCDISGT